MRFSSNSLRFSHTFNPFQKRKITGHLRTKVIQKMTQRYWPEQSDLTFSKPAFKPFRVFSRAKSGEFFKKNNIYERKK
jgi:hypothetical protein